jgi:hypothetical protein
MERPDSCAILQLTLIVAPHCRRGPLEFRRRACARLRTRALKTTD